MPSTFDIEIATVATPVATPNNGRTPRKKLPEHLREKIGAVPAASFREGCP
jgi:hypothetical protein